MNEPARQCVSDDGRSRLNAGVFRTLTDRTIDHICPSPRPVDSDLKSTRDAA